jgi:DNA gyrase subunit A
VDDIRVVGRNTQGVKVMNLNDGDKLATVAKVARQDVGE